MRDRAQPPLVLIDFGSQYTQLIARRLREMRVYCEVHPYTLTKAQCLALQPCGVILSGGPATTTVIENPRAPDWLFGLGLPVLGICYGMQTMAAQLGGKVATSSKKEFGGTQVAVHGHTQLLEGIEDNVCANGVSQLDVWMSHGDTVTALPPGFRVICQTANAPIAGMADSARRLYGLQFHPEVTHTTQGLRILERFALTICQAKPSWTPGHIKAASLAQIRATVGRDKVLLALSGGVDSSVVAALLHEAIGAQLVCVFVDTGLLRLGEASQVLDMFKPMGMRILHVAAEQRFLSALQGVSCPETKRKIIGRTFIAIFEEEAKKIPGVTWLAQGTIYPDVIESSKTHAVNSAIKSHHNVGGLPETLQLKLLEPLRTLFKDEVRKVGLALGLPHAMVYRHPFPGPGLSVRILGEVRKEFVDILRHADAIFIEELHRADLYHAVSQAFAVFLPIKSVGVMGDGRKYEYVICLRAVDTVDFMTAQWSRLPWDFLALVSQRIVNEVAGISRVTYDISGKPPATIEWE